jgi:thiol-disulfide isomerase/thioredoxin
VVAARDEDKLNAPIPAAAREFVLQADDLCAHDHADEAIEGLRRAIAIAPNYVDAHAKYIGVKGNYMGRYDEARAEYETLMAKEPDNPVYPMALGLAQYNTFSNYKNAMFKKVVELAPDWPWSHYAKAYLAADKEPETAVKELLEYIAKDGSSKSAYYFLSYVQESRLGRVGDAIVTAEKMAARPELHAEGLTMLWRLRQEREHEAPEAKAKLKNELDALAASSNDLKVLDAARIAYSSLLNDKESAQAIGKKISQLDPTWYPERGHTLYLGTSNMSGAPRLVVVPNRQYALVLRMGEVNDPSDPKARIAHLESLLAQNPDADVKRYIYEDIFVAAEKAKDTQALIKYGDLLFSIDPTDAGVPARIAIALTKRNEKATAALRYAKLADDATAVYRPLPRPVNNGRTDEEWNTTVFPEKQQREYYANLRSLALEAEGLALCQSRRCKEAEAKLRQALELHRSEQTLSDLAKILDRLGHKAEAEQFAEAAKVEYVASLKRSFGNDPAKDFELTALDGRRMKLSELQGKVVVLDFWATWCGPCLEETPFMVSLYKKYKDRGLEILYVSVDGKGDQYKVGPFASAHRITYPVLLDDGVKDLYGVQSFPTTIFIDREGKVRYQEVGFLADETPRLLDAVVSELLGPTTK